jgi:hypothetical protein
MHITKTYLWTVTKQGLKTLQKVLGNGVGLGITKKWPTKKLHWFIVQKVPT